MLIKGTVIQDRDTVLNDHGVLVKEDKIAAVEDAKKLQDKYPEHKIKEFDIIAPGFVQTHVHSVQTPGRGLADDTELFEWLYDYILPIEAKMTPEELELASKVSYLELLENGTTTCVDHLTVNHSKKAFQAAGEIGIRGVLGKAMMDKNAPDGLLEDTDNALRETKKLLHTYHKSFDGRIRYAVTPRFTPSCSEACLRESRIIADKYEDVLIHTHASEHKSVLDFVTENHELRDVEWLNKVGLLGEDVILAHVIYTDEKERQLLAETGTNVAHCPSSNMKIGAGVAPVTDYLERGINVTLGNDGSPANNVLDPITELRQAGLLQKVNRLDPQPLPAEQVFETATTSGAQAAGFNQVGKVKQGWKADLIGIDITSSRGVPLHDPISYLVYAANGSDVAFTMVNGCPRYEDDCFPHVNAKEILTRAKEVFESKPWTSRN